MEPRPDDLMELPPEEQLELTELILNPEVIQTHPSDPLVNQEVELGVPQETDSQPSTHLFSHVYDMSLISTPMLAAPPLAEIDFDIMSQDPGFGVDWPQDNTIGNLRPFDFDTQHGEANTIGTWPFYAFNPNYDPPLQPSAPMSEIEGIQASQLDTFLSGVWPFQGPGADHVLGDNIEAGASSTAETRQFGELNYEHNQALGPPLGWLTDFSDPSQHGGIGEMPAHNTHHLGDAARSPNLLEILNPPLLADTTIAPQIPNDMLSDPSDLTFDGQNAQSIPSVPIGASAQELQPPPNHQSLSAQFAQWRCRHSAEVAQNGPYQLKKDKPAKECGNKAFA
ncbi:hypothetical protein IL306_014754 [Fusarium sp. DS 682]|nr:hypothetical protein IL306_014754 [Fusarium sp. DS 682]